MATLGGGGGGGGPSAPPANEILYMLLLSRSENCYNASSGASYSESCTVPPLGGMFLIQKWMKMVNTKSSIIFWT